MNILVGYDGPAVLDTRNYSWRLQFYELSRKQGLLVRPEDFKIEIQWASPLHELGDVVVWGPDDDQWAAMLREAELARRRHGGTSSRSAHPLADEDFGLGEAPNEDEQVDADCHEPLADDSNCEDAAADTDCAEVVL